MAPSRDKEKGFGILISLGTEADYCITVEVAWCTQRIGRASLWREEIGSFSDVCLLYNGGRVKVEIFTELSDLVKNACGKFHLKTEMNWWGRGTQEETPGLTI